MSSHGHLTSQSTSLEWTEAVECPHCHARSRARTVARGTGISSYGHYASSAGREAAKAAAGVDAFSSAMGNAKRAIRRAKCPKCGLRGESAAFVFAVHLLFTAVAVAGAALLLHVVAANRPAPSGLLLRLLALSVTQLAIISGVVGAAVAPFTTAHALKKADETVRFEDAFDVPPATNYRS